MHASALQSSGRLTLNGGPTPYRVGAIESIDVLGGDGDHVIDLSGVNPYVL
jgi:hypothetical protein